jgi:hypothetical protein
MRSPSVVGPAPDLRGELHTVRPPAPPASPSPSPARSDPRLRPVGGPLQLGDVDLLHPHHRLDGPL